MRQCGVVIELNDAQIWTVVGVLAATLLSAFGLMAHFATRLLQESIGRVLDQFTMLDYRFEAIHQRFEAIDQRFKAIDQRFDALEVRVTERIDALDSRIGVRIDALDARITVLDRDVQAIANRVFGRGSATES